MLLLLAFLNKRNMKYLLPVLSVLAAVAIVYMVVHKQERNKYETFLETLGFGDIILSQMSFKELKAVHTYITEYTRKGKTVPEGSDLDRTLLKVAHKYEIINYI